MSQESDQKKEEEDEIKSLEQWRWSEMQGLELLPDNNNNSRNPETELRRNSPEMDNDGGAPPPPPTLVEEPKKAEIRGVAFKELFRFADGLDYVLMGIGSVGAFVHGCSLPLFLRFFADLVNSFGSNANNVDKMMEEVLKVLTFSFCSSSTSEDTNLFLVFAVCALLFSGWCCNLGFFLGRLEEEKTKDLIFILFS